MSVNVPATLIFAFVTTFTPGPNNILSASMGTLHGYRRTLPFILGIASGFFTLMLLCGALSTLLSRYVTAAAPTLRIIGGLYILWLALGVYRSGSKLLEPAHDARPLRFWNGYVLQFMNPKCIFYGLTMYTTFLAPLLEVRSTLAWTPVLLAGVSFSSVSTWALGGQLIRRWISTPGRARALGIVLSLALVYTALDLAGVLR